MKLRPLIAFLILGVLAVVLYSSAFHGPFIFDDGMYISKNPLIKNLWNFWPPSGPRYLGYLSFALDFRLGGLDTFGYHIVNVIIHIINGLLVYALVTSTFKTPWMERAQAEGREKVAFFLALITSVLFVVHPVQTQAVTYITQRFASLATLFYLLSLVSYIRWRLSSGPKGFKVLLYIVSLASAVAAQNTKEISFTLPIMIVLYELVFFGCDKKRIPALVPFILTLAIIPLTIFGPEAGLGGGAADIGEKTRELQVRDLTALSRHDYLVTQFRVVVTYLRLIVLPVNQTLDYDYPLFTSIFSAGPLLSFLFLLAIAVVAVWIFVKSRRANCALGLLFSSGVFWFFMTLSIESSIIPINDLIFEHRLYLAMPGAALAFGSALIYILRFAAGKKVPAVTLALMITAVVAVPLSVATYMRNAVWADEVVFWQDAVVKSPMKARVHNNLGSVYHRKGDLARAMDSFKKAIELKPNFADAHYNLGVAYKDIGRMDDAILEFEAAVTYQPQKANAHNNLGLAYLSKGRIEDAVGEFSTTIRLEPSNYRAHNNLGLAYKYLGRYDEAASEFETALSINPGFEDAYDNLRYLESKRGAGPPP